MKLPTPSYAATALIFMLAIASMGAFVAYEVFQLGKESARAECKPVPIKKLSYDMSKREMKRWIKYELAKGGV